MIHTNQTQYSEIIRVVILDDHLSTVEGYIFRLGQSPDIQIIATFLYSEELESFLEKETADILLLDLQVPISRSNGNNYPILTSLPKLLKAHPDLAVLVITMHSQRNLIQVIMEAGASGYILKDDQESLRKLATIVRAIANGRGIYLSPKAGQLVKKSPVTEFEQPLSPRQLEALSLCAAYPDAGASDLATRMHITSSTLRNLLFGAYIKLGVHSRAAAVARADQLGLLVPTSHKLDLESLE